jgi:hypothetical protein
MKNKILKGNPFTYEYVQSFIETNSDCKLISTEYINTDTKLLLKCACGTEFAVSFYKFKQRNKRQCNECSLKANANKRRYTYDYVKRSVAENGCILLSDKYIGSDKKLKFQCICGNELEASYNTFLNLKYKLCATCVKKIVASKRKFTYEEVKQYIEVESDSKCKLLSTEYDKVRSKLLFLCHCGENFETDFQIFKYAKKYQCNTCAKQMFFESRAFTHVEFVEKVYELVKGEYSVIGEYTKSQNKVKIKHNVCGNEWDVRAQSFIEGCRCPSCNYSKAENKILEILNKYKIDYKCQYKITECKDKRSLPFDFAIFNNNKLICLIEADGKQHYEEVHFGGISREKAASNLKNVKKHDEIKNNFCAKNDIDLIRIPYWEFKNISNTLIDKLNVYNLLH